RREGRRPDGHPPRAVRGRRRTGPVGVPVHGAPTRDVGPAPKGRCVMAVKWQWNLAGFAQLRNHPSLVDGMTSVAQRAATATPYEVRVEVWPHSGRRSGPRTSV